MRLWWLAGQPGGSCKRRRPAVAAGGSDRRPTTLKLCVFVIKNIGCCGICCRKVLTLLGAFRDLSPKVDVSLDVFVKSNNFTMCF